MTLEEEKQRTDANVKAMKAVLGWIRDLDRADAIRVLQHVGIEFGVDVKEKWDGKPAAPAS